MQGQAGRSRRAKARDHIIDGRHYFSETENAGAISKAAERMCSDPQRSCKPVLEGDMQALF